MFLARQPDQELSSPSQPEQNFCSGWQIWNIFQGDRAGKMYDFGINWCGGKVGYGPRSLCARGEGGGTPNRNSGLWLYPQLPPLLHAHAFLLFLWFLIPTYQQISNCGNSDMKVEENDTRHLCAAMIGKLQTRIPSCKFTAYFGPPESVFDYPLDKWPWDRQIAEIRTVRYIRLYYEMGELQKNTVRSAKIPLRKYRVVER